MQKLAEKAILLKIREKIIKEAWNANPCFLITEPAKRITIYRLDNSNILSRLGDSTGKNKKYVSEPEFMALNWYLNKVHLKIGNHKIPQNKGVTHGGILCPFPWLISIDELAQNKG